MKFQKNKKTERSTPSIIYFVSFILSLMLSSFYVHAADYIYISDNLRVGVRTEPVSGVPPISVVFTGMRLEVLERTEGYIKIKTDKGVEGWVKDIYVTKKAPAIIQLNTFRAKYDKLKQELSQGGETSKMLEKANMALSEQLDELKTERREWSRERAEMLASQYKETSWLWIVELIVLAVASFAAGFYWHRSQAMKRLGGLRF